MSTTLGKLREYETIYVINPERTDEEVTEINDRLKGVLQSKGASLLREDTWGKKKMAYESRKQTRGNYIILHYAAEPEAVLELERIMRNIEHIHRFMTELHGPVVDVAAKQAEVDKAVRDRAAAKEKAEAERKEREAEEAQAVG
jgi:small subunit ribosomal protein S6